MHAKQVLSILSLLLSLSLQRAPSPKTFPLRNHCRPSWSMR